MSASKKTTTKTTKSPAPATRSAAAKPAAAKKTTRAASAPAARPKAAAALPVASAPAPAAPAAPAPIRAVAPKPVVTLIRARVDVGFGNALFFRGTGPGLSWDRGVPMQCVGADLWQIELPESARGYTFKFLVNDERWSAGADFAVASGESATLTPEF